MTLNISKIKHIMAGLKIGNKDLSLKSGVPLRTINNILGGITTNPTIDNLISIAHALNCKVDDLIYDDTYNDEPHTIAAHFDGDEYSEEQLNRIKAFAAFIKSEENK